MSHCIWFLNLIPQDAWHDDGCIVGSRRGLLRLVWQCLMAAIFGGCSADYYASDGEGYALQVVAMPPDKAPGPFYAWWEIEKYKAAESVQEEQT